MELILRNSIAIAQHRLTQLYGLLPALAIMVFSYFIIVASMSTASFYRYFFGEATPKHLGFLIFIPALSSLLFIVIPALVNKYCLKQPFREIGLQIPKNKLYALVLTVLALAYTLPVFTYLTQQSSFQYYYGFGPTSPLFFISVQLFLFPIYYFAEEVFFRGFLFLTLWERIGWHSFWISDVLFAMAHLGKPPLEILVSIPASVLFNYITLRSRSIYPSFFVHTCLGIFVFTVINLHSVRW